MKEAMVLRDYLHLRQEVKFAADRLDMRALEELTKEACEKGMQDDIAVITAIEIYSQLVAERDYKHNHPAYKFMRKNDIDESSASRYLTAFADDGYDCLLGLAMLVVKQDDKGEHALEVLKKLGVRSAMHRERIVKNLNHVKLPKLNQSSLVSFMKSMNFSDGDVKRYKKSLWDSFKYDTMFDLLDMERDQFQKLNFLPGHVDAIVMVSDGLHSKFAIEQGGD